MNFSMKEWLDQKIIYIILNATPAYVKCSASLEFALQYHTMRHYTTRITLNIYFLGLICPEITFAYIPSTSVLVTLQLHSRITDTAVPKWRTPPEDFYNQ